MDAKQQMIWDSTQMQKKAREDWTAAVEATKKAQARTLEESLDKEIWVASKGMVPQATIVHAYKPAYKMPEWAFYLEGEKVV